MKVNQKFVFDDRSLRQIAQEGMGHRSGKATRQEVRLWLNKLVDSTLQTMNEPKVRRRATTVKHLALCQFLGETWFCAADCPHHVVVDLEQVCVHCRRPRNEHGKSSKACPLSRSYSKPTKFKAEPDDH